MLKKNIWDIQKITATYEQAFNNLLYHAHQVHREYHTANKVQLAKLLSIKTGACPEDCRYCSQSGHYKTNIQKEKLMNLASVLDKAKQAKQEGAKRFCMGAAWRTPPDHVIAQLQAMISQVKAMGLETCMTLGMLSQQQAQALKNAGLDFYNHNIDTSPAFYDKIVTTRTFNERLKTIENVREAGIKVCCGGILGLGESRQDRIEFLLTLSNMQPPPESIPINCLIPVAGTPLEAAVPVEGLELVRTIATARIIMPLSVIRLTAGRTSMTDELQALCYFAGSNSIFIGDKLLTEDNPQTSQDQLLFKKLGIAAFDEQN